MAGQLIRQAADFTPAHGIRLSGQRKGAAPFAPNFAARQMHVDDRIAFITAARRLVNAHGVKRHRPVCLGEPLP
ncbi:hypothetical protein D3C75_1040480 [compost metagenome]